MVSPHTCPFLRVPIWLLQLYVEAGPLIVLLVVNYSNGYGLPADETVHTTTVEGRSEVRGHALVNQHTVKHTHRGRQMQSDSVVMVPSLWQQHSNRDEEEMMSHHLADGGRSQAPRR